MVGGPALIPIALLLAVAVHQRWRVSRYGQSAWKGGGFGMFSDLHTGSVTALLRTTGSANEVAEFLVVFPWDMRASVIPTEANLRLTAQEILHNRWTGVGRRAAPCRESERDNALVLSSVTVRYARIDFDRQTGAHMASVRRSVTVTPTKR